jgi:hypothetical protein
MKETMYWKRKTTILVLLEVGEGFMFWGEKNDKNFRQLVYVEGLILQRRFSSIGLANGVFVWRRNGTEKGRKISMVRRTTEPIDYQI